MLIRLFTIGLIIFVITIAVLYGYRIMAKKRFPHTTKVLGAGVITFAVIAVFSVLEG